MSRLSASPVLTVSPSVKIRRTRRLPMEGEVLVKPGDEVAASDTVAKASVPGMLHPIDAARLLGISPSDLSSALCIREGDAVTKGQIIAQSRALFGLQKKEVPAPCSGTAVSVSPVTGRIMLAEAKTPLCLPAYLPGRVSNIDETGTVEIEARVSLIQGIFGVGGERFGRLVEIPSIPEDGDIFSTDELRDIDAKNTVFFSPKPLCFKALEAMRNREAAAVITGSVPGGDLMRLAGRTLNPACTGDENIGLCIVLTEGFGRIPAAPRTAALLKQLQHQNVSVNGAVQVRAGVIRPEIIGPPAEADIQNRIPAAEHSQAQGDTVRIIRGEHFGELGTVRSAPHELRRIGSGAETLVYQVELSSGTRAFFPRANVEPV